MQIIATRKEHYIHFPDKICVGSLYSLVYTGLENDREYNCCVAAIGIKEQKVFSGVVTAIAL